MPIEQQISSDCQKITVNVVDQASAQNAIEANLRFDDEKYPITLSQVDTVSVPE